jgi:hypothetical protein
MAIADLWYKNAIIYCLDVEKYQDANGDGVGDFEGLMRRLDYLQGLGVTCVWLQPFYPSPNRDNGYDVTDFFGVHEKHGSLGDFVAFMRHAEALGVRVIIDLVRQSHLDRFAVVQARPHQSRRFLPPVVRVVRHPSQEPQRRHRVSRSADDDLDVGSPGEAVSTSIASTTISPI